MPRYMAIATNQQFADAANGTMNGARAALVLALTCMEAIINFLIDIYRSTFLCFLDLVVSGGLSLLISAVQEVQSFLQNTINGIVSGLVSDANSVNSAIQSAVNAVNKVNPFGNINAPQFNTSSLSQLQNITIPNDFENALIKLNSSLPTLSSIKDAIQGLVDTPFEAVKQDINNTFANLTFDPTLFPIPQQNTITFCDSLDTSSVDNLGQDLLKAAEIGTIILAVAALVLLAGFSVLEWYKWRCLQFHLSNTREAWASDPTVDRSGPDQAVPTVVMTNHNLLMLQVDAQHPMLTRMANFLAALLHLSRSQHIHLRWFLHYIFHPPALACFLIGFFGILSVELQLLAVGPLEAKYSAQTAQTVNDLSSTIAAQMNASMYNQSSVYASGINLQVASVQNTINQGVFGWVNGTTTTLNATLNSFYADVTGAVTSVFNGTILENPALDFVNCLIGSKVEALEDALTFLNENLNVDLPRVNESVLVLSPADVNEVTQPITAAAIGGGDGSSSGGVIARLVATYVDSLLKERIMFAVFLGLWGVVVVMGLAVVFWHSYARDWVEAYKRRRWQREQRDGIDAFEPAAYGYHGAGERATLVAEKPDAEKGEKGRDDVQLRSFAPVLDESPQQQQQQRSGGFSLGRSLTKLRMGPLTPKTPKQHPLENMNPAFEKSWDSFHRQDTEAQANALRDNEGASGSKWFQSIGRRMRDSEIPKDYSFKDEAAPPKSVPKSKWLGGLFGRKTTADSDESFGDSTPAPSPDTGSARSSPRGRPNLRISTGKASGMRSNENLPDIEVHSPTSTLRDLGPGPEPLPVENLKSAWSVSPTSAQEQPQPPTRRMPPPPPRLPLIQTQPQTLQFADTPGHKFPVPLHHGFAHNPEPPTPPAHKFYPAAVRTHLAPPPAIPPSQLHLSTVASSRKPTIVSLSPDRGPRSESTTPVTRLLTTQHARKSSGAVDPFATPFDDTHAVSSGTGASPTTPSARKRVTNPFAGGWAV
ncbi:hypothetical protein CONPUDRAFT_101927 [Coniophora puteana RWD-64-598 SS2]|uniref:Plasma membrane fusion protein PRM1 n=1 Tax=Coniophora puteana (strain RWD-64-598) TaxID=741705 RepID=A0A5M3MWY8_CONPW|nr:uncharacterized protein CONPUDRAFT_101927 [Coniophora puteana RWD-64-598 SS2]EIW83225.1 hypothetical protein CONPUDRAFT_101927 [Coniophora puteana RWD-64-598 SS2]